MPTVLVNNHVFSVADGAIIYDELEKQNLILPHGCLAGSCGACKIEIKSGAKNLSAPGAVELDTLLHLKDGDKIIRLACRAKVLGDITISY
jgi:ferredoxin